MAKTTLDHHDTAPVSVAVPAVAPAVAEESPATPSSISLLGLRQVPLLAGMSDERLAELAPRLRWRQFDGGQTLRYGGGAQEQRLYIVVQGGVRIASYGGNGRSVTFVDWTTGSYFGELEIFDPDADMVAHAQTLEPTLIASLSREEFVQLLCAEPSVTRMVLQRLGKIVHSLASRLHDLSTLGVRTRLLVRLLRMATEAAGAAASSFRIDPAPRHSDMASRIGTTREEVTREVSRLVREGLVRKEGSAWLLPDLGALRQRIEEARH